MSALEQEVEKIVLLVLADREAEGGQVDEADDYRRLIAVINAKESPPERRRCCWAVRTATSVTSSAGQEGP